MKQSLLVLLAIALLLYATWYARADRMSIKPVAVAAVAIVLLLLCGPTMAHDHNRPDLEPWLKSLHAKDTTWCCNGDDTDAIEDWETSGNRYRVKFRGQWFDVPEGSIVDGPNKGTDALLWMNKGWSELSVRCFMPGSMT